MGFRTLLSCSNSFDASSMSLRYPISQWNVCTLKIFQNSPLLNKISENFAVKSNVDEAFSKNIISNWCLIFANSCQNKRYKLNNVQNPNVWQVYIRHWLFVIFLSANSLLQDQFVCNVFLELITTLYIEGQTHSVLFTPWCPLCNWG